jgi:predicted Zn-dependent peptidase
MNRVGRGQLIHGHVMSFEETVARTEAVTHDDLRRVADRILSNERVLAVVGPFGEEDFAARVA